MDNFNQNDAFIKNQFNEEQINGQSFFLEEMQRREYFRRRSFNRLPLIFALIGLLLSFAFGLGIAFAIPAFIMGLRRNMKAPSKSLRWAIAISAVTVFLCVIFIFSTFYAIAMGFLELTNA